MSSAKLRVSLASTCLLLTLPACGQSKLAPVETKDYVAAAADSRLLPKSTKIEDVKAKAVQVMRERYTFNPFRHKGDFAIVVSAGGVLIGGFKLIYEIRRNRKKKDPLATVAAR